MTDNDTPTIDRKARMQLEPVHKPYRPVEARIQDFEESSPGYSPEQAMAEAARCIQCGRPVCVVSCPLGNNIPLALSYIEQGEFEKAAEVYRLTNPIPEICGRVCPPDSSCSGSCTLSKRGRAIDTGALEAFVADYQREHGGVPLPEKAPPTGRKVAVIGAGPAGMAAAEELVKAGHEVTVYEGMSAAGGLLVYGIPSFKLNKALVEWKAGWLQELGIEFVFNTRIGQDITLDDLVNQEGFDAVFLGTGAEVEASMNIPGQELGGIYGSLDFLMRANVRTDWLPPEKQEPVSVGKRVAVIGGGDTATDCLRTAIRLGAEDVTCYYRRTEVEMPGNSKERHHAEEEGAAIEYLTAPVEFLDKSGDGHVDAMIMIRMELGEPDDSGRRRPVKVEGSEYEVAIDNVVLAIGFWPDPLLSETTPELETHKWGLIVVDEETGKTSRANIFAGGDNVTGPALVNAALAAGKRAAFSIDALLSDNHS